MDLARFSIQHARAIVFLTAALTVLGVWAYLRTPASIFPDMRFSRVDVVAEAGNLPPEQVRIAVLVPLEQAFLGLRSVRRVVSKAEQGSAEWVVEFDPHSDVQSDLQNVNAAVGQTRSQIPAADNIVANVVTPESEPVLSYALTSPLLSQALVREYAQQHIVPALYGTPGLARILVVGGAQREYHVDLDPAALAAAGLSAQDVGNAIAQANQVTAVGITQDFTQRHGVLVDARLRDASQIAAIVVPTRSGAGIPVGSLGATRLGIAPLTAQMSFDATHAVAMNFYVLPGADSVRMAGEIKRRFAAIGSQLPADLTPHLYWDSTDLIVASQQSLRDAILLGSVLALGVIFFFLRNLRMTLVAAIVIPAAMSIAVLALSVFGETLNIMSVGGLAIAVGLIIDDAIVVIEGIARTLHESQELSLRDAVVATMRRLIAPMTASTLTTVVVFVPLTLLGGVSGAFFRALALTLACALFVSLGLALFVTPILFRTLLGRRTPHDENAGLARALDRYEPILRWALAHRGAVYGMAAGVLAVTVALIATLPSDFLPQLDEGQFEIDYRMPVGTTLRASDAAATVIERTVLADPAVSAVGRVTGVDHGLFERGVGAVGDLGVVAAMKPVVEHGRQIARDTFHAARADRFDPRLLDRVEHGARRLVLRHEAAMDADVVTGEAQRHRVAVAAYDRGFARCQLARRLRQTRPGAFAPPMSDGRSGAKVTSRSWLRDMARMQPATARLNGSCGASAFWAGLRLVGGGTATRTLSGSDRSRGTARDQGGRAARGRRRLSSRRRSATHSGSSWPKQRW